MYAADMADLTATSCCCRGQRRDGGEGGAATAEGLVWGLFPRQRRQSWRYNDLDSTYGGQDRSCGEGYDCGNDTTTNVSGGSGST